MEKEQMEITPQDIIEKEFRVKFRGFDMAEVDSFLEEIAESFFKLTEENTLLNEKVIALQQDLETAESTAPQRQVELPPELGDILEDLKQDTTAISVELTGLKQERQTLDALKEKLEKVIASLQEAGAEMMSGPQAELPGDLAGTLETYKESASAIAAELAALKEDRETFDTLKKSFEEVISSAKETASSLSPGAGSAAIPADLTKTLEDFMQGTATIGVELAALKQEFGKLSGMRAEIKKELQEQLSAYFEGGEAKFSPASGTGIPAAQKSIPATPAPGEKEKLVVAKIEKEPEGYADEKSLPNYRQQEQVPFEGDDLEFLSEDDILDVDKLRGIFQSVLDEGISDAHESREGDDAAADLLFLDDDDFSEDEHEPEVTFSLDEYNTDTKQNNEKP
jgi:cell division initiation protein